MEVSQPIIIFAAFVLGFGFMFVTRIVWSVLKGSMQFALLAAVLMLVAGQVTEKGERSSLDVIRGQVATGIQAAASAVSNVRSWAAAYELELRVVPKHTAKSEN